MGHANLRFWSALEYADIDDKSDKSKRTLVVTGQAEVKEAPTLEEVNAKSGVLFLKFSTLEQMSNSWKTVWFEKKINSGEYDKVQLLIPSGAHATGGHLKVNPAPREFRCSDAVCSASEILSIFGKQKVRAGGKLMYNAVKSAFLQNSRFTAADFARGLDAAVQRKWVQAIQEPVVDSTTITLTSAGVSELTDKGDR